eukprot:6181694-Pleurochrysis_carterae.AAC.4
MSQLGCHPRVAGRRRSTAVNSTFCEFYATRGLIDVHVIMEQSSGENVCATETVDHVGRNQPCKLVARTGLKPHLLYGIHHIQMEQAPSNPSMVSKINSGRGP